MNLSRKWLREFVDVDCGDHEFAEAMTLSGSKVETTERLSDEIKNVVVGKIVSMVRHENSDHMWICKVDVGGAAPLQIVTGAQNQQEGDLVPVALHDSYLPGGVHITRGKLRGELSDGMCCSIAELGLTLHDVPYAYENGLWVLQEEGAYPGQDINEVIGNDDSVVEFEITNNRPDCFSLIGLAREAACTFRKPLKLHEPVVQGSAGAGSIFDHLDVETPDPDLCRRYTARMVTNVKVGPSPKWMRQRLRACGVRPINNIVDITNYVMLEYGQPMHAFDYRYVKGGKIVVRRAQAGETLTTLDSIPRPIQPGMLVIADDHKPIGLAGIMGGENSEIVDDTVQVVFESANFDGTSIRKTAIALGMRTDASAKFEKNLDPLNTLPAVQRACELVELLGAGEIMDGVIDVINEVPQPFSLPLGFEVEDGIVHVPSWRPDVRRMADLAEEVARFYGYGNIPTTMFRGVAVQGGYTRQQQKERELGAFCRSLGYDEILTYSFGSPAMFDQIRLPADSPLRSAVTILNPLGEDTSIMRTTALPSMLETLGRNNAYHNRAVKLYEIAKIYLPRDGQTLPDEPKVLMLGSYGAGGDFFTLKGEIEAILRQIGTRAPSFEAVMDNPSYHPGRCASVVIDGVSVGCFGQVHPLAAENYGL
ncbi:MAG: phenylalanine--tRNA ligase subunit beta, partial [Clostridiales bacterium]|nr:phenylalanine--tRNA ligase subunit beta [Clostridiales bacterium]